MLEARARQQGVAGAAIMPGAASMDSLPFAEGELDVVWSEGAIDNIGLAEDHEIQLYEVHTARFGYGMSVPRRSERPLTPKRSQTVPWERSFGHRPMIRQASRMMS